MSLLNEFKSGTKPLCWGPALLYPNAVWEQTINLGVPSVDEFEFEIYARANECSQERLFDVPFVFEDDDNGNKVICTQAVNDLTDILSSNEIQAGMISVHVTCQFTEIADPNKTRILVFGDVYLGSAIL